MTRITFSVILLGLTLVGYSQLTITGEIRPRAEYRNGFKTLRQDNRDEAFFVEQRSRLGIGFVKEKLSLKLSFQDVRFWGGTSQIYKEDNALFNVNEAWAGYAFSTKSKLIVGRQMLDYDNARILGDLDWAQQARSHDVVKYEYSDQNGLKLHIGAAFNQETVNANPEPSRLFDTFYSGVNNYKTMQYAWANKKLKKGTLSLLFLSNGFQVADTTQNFIFTTGSYFKTKLASLDLTGELYYQFGKDVTNRTIDAYMIAVDLGKKLGSVYASIGTDYLTGSELTSSKNNSFEPLFGTNHKFYGYMDYFYVGNTHQNTGLTDIFAKLNFTLGEKSNLLTHVHYFSIPVRLENSDGSRAPAHIGTEIDLVYNLKIQKDINWKLGFSAMDPTSSMGLIKPGNPSKMTSWAWTMLTFKPVLWKSGEE